MAGRRAISGRRAETLYRDETEALLELARPRSIRPTRSAARCRTATRSSSSSASRWRSDPKLLLLDEPTAGMSAAETREAIRLLERIAAERELTLLFTEHDMDVVFSIAQKIAVLHQGRLIAEGTPAEVRADPEVRRVYLGGATRAVTRLLDSRSDIHTAYGSLARAVRRLARGRARRMRLPARPQRRRQDHDHARHHGTDAAAPRAASCGRARTSPAWPPYRIARAGIGFVPEDRRIFADLTVLENLDVSAQPRPAAGALDRRGGVRAVSEAARARRPRRAAFSPAASSRC